jgi:outer membrane protein OmpA-like peptidoglycan-associated protein
VTPIPKMAQPEKVATIKGKILNSNKLPITDAEIRIINLSTGETAGTLRTDPQTGEYFAVLPQGNYGYELIKEGYFPIHGNINTQNIQQQIDVLEDVTLYKYSEMKDENIALPLRNLFFDTNRFVIKQESFNELNELADIVKQNNFRIEIGGHTDNEGDSKSNLVLSENRAKEVKNYLIGQGCNPLSITAKGYGETKPVSTNNNVDGKSKNRRVDVRIKK